MQTWSDLQRQKSSSAHIQVIVILRVVKIQLHSLWEANVLFTSHDILRWIRIGYEWRKSDALLIKAKFLRKS